MSIIAGWLMLSTINSNKLNNLPRAQQITQILTVLTTLIWQSLQEELIMILKMEKLFIILRM